MPPPWEGGDGKAINEPPRKRDRARDATWRRPSSNWRATERAAMGRAAMMRLPRFHYFAPRTVADAAALLAEPAPQALLVAGGTDLWPNMKRRQQTPTRVIGLRGVAALRGVRGAPASGFDRRRA